MCGTGKETQVCNPGWLGVPLLSSKEPRLEKAVEKDE